MISNEQTKAFYKSTVWEKCREKILSRDLYLCQECLPTIGPVPADTVHHIKYLKDYPELALDEDNLISVCASCHNKLHPEKSRKRQAKRKTSSRINVVEIMSNPEIF